MTVSLRVTALLVVTVLAVAGCTDGSDGSPPGAPSGDAPSGEGAWARLADGPLSGRVWPVTAWTGDELVVWGGFGAVADPDDERARRDGAAYDPRRGQWRDIPEAPIAPSPDQQSVWTGDGVLIWEAVDGSAQEPQTAAFDPDANAWREVADAPLPRLDSDASVAWTGEEMVVVGTDAGWPDAHPNRPADLDQERRGRVVAAAYDPGADTWRELAPPPLPQPRFGPQTVWTGEQLVVWGGAAEEPIRALGDQAASPSARQDDDSRVAYGTEAVAYDPASGAWRQLADAPETVVGATGQARWDARQVVVPVRRDGAWQLWAYDHEDGEATAFAPRLPSGQTPMVWELTGAEVLAVVGATPRREGLDRPVGHRYDPEDAGWQPLPTPPLRQTEELTATWNGRAWLLWGGKVAEAIEAPRHVDDGAVWRPGAEPTEDADGEGDWQVSVDVEVDGDAPIDIEGGATTFSYDDATRLPLAITAEQPATVAAPRVDGRVTSGEGVLLAVGAECGWRQARGRPDIGLTGACPSGPRPEGVLVRPGQPLASHLALRAQPEPHAPTPGDYRLTGTVAVDGDEVAFTATVTLRGRTPEGRDPRDGQADRRAALRPEPCHRHEHELVAGQPGDGGLRVHTDGVAWFGRRSFGARQARYGPPGSEPAERVGLNVLVIGDQPMKGCAQGHAPRSELVEQSRDRMVTRGTTGQVAWRLTQQVEAGTDGAGALTQRWRLEPAGDQPVDVPLRRWVSLEEPDERGVPVDEQTPAFADVDVSAEANGASVRVPVAGGAASTLVEVGGRLDGTSPTAWTVQWHTWYETIRDDGITADLDGEIDLDGLPGSRPAGVGVAQQWQLRLEPGQQAVLEARLGFEPD